MMRNNTSEQSVLVAVRVSKDLHDAMIRGAADEERSVSALIRFAVRKHLADIGHVVGQEVLEATTGVR